MNKRTVTILIILNILLLLSMGFLIGWQIWSGGRETSHLAYVETSELFNNFQMKNERLMELNDAQLKLLSEKEKLTITRNNEIKAMETIWRYKSLI